MGHKGSAVKFFNWEIYLEFFLLFVLISAARNSVGVTNPTDGKNGLDRSLSFIYLFG